MRVEPATTADVDAVVDAWVALAGTQREHGSHLDAEANREAIRPILAHHVVDGSLLVARSAAGAVVGFVNVGLEAGSLAADARRGVIHNLYVEPSVRGEGVGSALLDAAEALLADRGAAVVAIEAMAENVAARRLYRRRGYAPHRVQFEKLVGERSAERTTATETDTSETE